MRKFYSFLMLLGLASGFPASAQDTPTKKMAHIKTQNVIQREDGSDMITDKESEYFYYDKNGNLLADALYYLPAHNLHSNKEYTYDSQNRLTVFLLSYGSNPNEKRTYEYNGKGQLSTEKKYSISAGVDNLSATIEYGYDSKGQKEIATHYNDQGKGLEKYLYYYDAAGQPSYQEYYSTNQGNFFLAERTDYAYNKDGQLLKDSITSISAAGEAKPKSANHYEYENGKLAAVYKYSYTTSQGEPKNAQDVSGYDYLAAEAAVHPSYKEVYEYDNEGDLIKKTDLSWDGNKYLDSKYYFYSTGTYCKDYVIENFRVEAAQEVATVKISLDPPAVTDGLEGYKVMVDGIVLEKLYPADQTTLTVSKQAKGTHIYKVLGVYGGVISNVSEGVEFTVEVNCPAPTNLRATAYEWNATFSNWKVQLIWDAPAESGLTLKEYRATSNDVNKGSTSNTNINVQHYGKQNDVSFKIYAVYEEGESEPVELVMDLSDTNKQLTEHWNNSGYETKDYNGQLLGGGYYYYGNTASAEKLLYEVKYDASKTPVQKITHEENSDTYYSWDAAAWQWINDMKVVYNRNQNDVLVSIVTKILDKATGKLVDSKKEEYVWDENDPYGDPVKTKYYELTDGELAVTSVVKHEYNTVEWVLQSQTNTRYDAQEQNILDKEVIEYAHDGYVTQETHTFYDNTGKNITGKSVYDYVKSEVPGAFTTYKYEASQFVPESKTEWEYSPNTNLIVSEKRTVYHDAEWVDEQTTAYAASPAYHSTHTVSEVQIGDMTDNGSYLLSWKAPVRTEGLVSYKVFMNEVEMTAQPLAKDAVSYEVKVTKAGFYRFNVMAIYEQGVSSFSNIVTLKIDPVAYATVKEMKQAGAGKAGYEVTGEVLVTGSVEIDNVTSWFVEDESAAIRVIMPEGMVFPFAKGNMIKNMVGTLSVNGKANTFTFESAKLVSEANMVVQTIKSIADINANLADNEGRWVKINEADCNVTGDLLPERFETTQDGSSIDVYIGKQEIDNPKGKAIYSGFVCLEGEKPFIVLNGNFVDGISTPEMTSDTVYYSNGKIMAEGASAIEIYDVAGRRLVASQSDEINVNGMRGTLVVKIVYVEGNVKVMKLGVK